jgi:hypothetical protein
MKRQRPTSRAAALRQRRSRVNRTKHWRCLDHQHVTLSGRPPGTAPQEGCGAGRGPRGQGTYEGTDHREARHQHLLHLDAPGIAGSRARRGNRGPEKVPAPTRKAADDRHAASPGRVHARADARQSRTTSASCSRSRMHESCRRSSSRRRVPLRRFRPSTTCVAATAGVNPSGDRT